MANFIIDCPSCQRQLRLPEELQGKQVRCPQCDHTFTAQGPEQGAPPAPESIRPAPDPERPWTPPREQEFDRPSQRREDDDDDYEEVGWYRGEVRYSRQTALDAVNGPATALLVTGWISVALCVVGLCANVFLLGVGGAGGGRNQDTDALVSGAVGIPLRILGLVLSILIIVGANKMKRLESYGFAMAASIIAILPCHGCCILGLPFGIWSLVILSKPEVKDAFR